MPVIKVRLFSHIKYAFAKDEIELEISDGETTNDLERIVRKLGGDPVASIPFRIAVNQEFISQPQIINADDEIALIPPVQGG